MRAKKLPTPSDLEADTQGMERLVFFSDAVFAIAITLLVLEIRLPAGFGSLDDSALLAALLAAWQPVLAYGISFLVIGSFWMAHHRKFQFIRRYDRRLIWLNLLVLMVTAFLPFPTSILSENSNRVATIFYALTVITAGLLFTAMWLYACRHGLTIPLHPREVRFETIRSLITPAVFLLSIGLAGIDADLAKYSWLLILIVLPPFLNSRLFHR